MAYTIILAPEAVDDLRRLKASTQATVRGALITHLAHQPTRLSKSRIKWLEQFGLPGEGATE